VSDRYADEAFRDLLDADAFNDVLIRSFDPDP